MGYFHGLETPDSRASVPAEFARKTPQRLTTQLLPVQIVQKSIMIAVENLDLSRASIPCLSGGGRRKSSNISSYLTPAGHSLGKDSSRPKSVHASLIAAPSGHPRAINVDRHTGAQSRTPSIPTSGSRVHDDSRSDPSKQASIPPVYGPHHSKVLLAERTEVPNTPTQRSSQLEFPNTTSRTQESVKFNADEPVLDAPAQSQEHAPPRTLCSACRKHWVSSTTENEIMQCRPCLNRSLITTRENPEIPETPDASPSRDTLTQNNTVFESSAAFPDPCITASTTTPASVSDPVASKPKIGSVHNDEIICTTTKPQQDSTESHDPAEVFPAAGIVVQIVVCEPDQVKTTSMPLDKASLRKPRLDHQERRDAEFVLEASTVLQEDRPMEALPSTVSGLNQAEKSASPRSPPAREVEKNIDILEADHPGPNTGESTSVDGSARPVSHSEPSTNRNPRSRTPPVPEKRHTNRELAQIALAGANGSRLTSSQMTGWLVQKFPYLQEAQIAWARSFKTVLSRFPEFVSSRAPRARGSTKVYGFATTQHRVRFETEYQAYCAEPVSGTNHLPPRTEQDQHRAETITQPAHGAEWEDVCKELVETGAPTPSKPRSQHQYHSTTQPAIRAHNEDTLCSLVQGAVNKSTPTRRVVAPISPKMNPIATFIASSSSTPTLRMLSIETMTPAEKASKIAEIRARPSRKTFFGSDYRLAHVRRYGRQDIHDESDGAWKKPTKKEKDSRSSGEKAGVKHDTRTLRGIFGLPTNAVPMNDGQELAFRDGTLINGKLPRSRQTYRVGKMFGGELTTRLS
ncbi:hypothetical protein BDW02DRAFT_579049 [Decorospora gaudefroyi]|uniref:Fork-head domain-containing protein n=1 Tax=Decorospora gaudefroyi TaxID=184978 RepID=A0A6A5KL18_9PLEO|nr:hypothetical protein BDW02DRAFT_579049 [Decorospora gaudefroyi]